MNKVITMTKISVPLLCKSLLVPNPDTKGTTFLFSTPICSSEFQEQMHVIPQVTEVVNVTLKALETNNQYTRSEYKINADDSLHLKLPCIKFEWELAKPAGKVNRFS